ncbi:phosphatidylglycerol--membrane-oligosaccharide glycerophosphotransferase [Enterobacter cancerogenus]|jgi:phosphoglycerol transferase|uniref:Phosphatidylglycerol--membrane-oligosaccharide glycerophosphotransferase n=1 Tax=Enterobacter cancerogenus TaxID=69218 RepID=A0ABX8KIL6_9ENTR|nr:phosphatidylglycerol--membrane-oligosaccharide glycerophosphotransferase [Enterobacter cancerogenus]QXA48135.1 phosphatidylglycerol--membrane-oligosaccharide glycerophosphotransferase [Enterobacter cancerogenus]
MESFSLLMLSVCFIFCATAVYRYKSQQNAYISVFIFVLTVVSVLLDCFWVVCQYFTGDGVNESVLYTLTTTMEGGEINDYIFPSILAILFCVVTIIVIHRILFHGDSGKKQSWTYAFLATCCSVLALLISPAFSQISRNTLLAEKIDGSDFNEYFINEISQIEKPKFNLVYIYGESLERTYFNNDVFPDLLPDLNKFREKSMDFSDTLQMPATDFTIAGIVASQCGLPLFKPTAFNGQNTASSFYPESHCLGDILSASGYETYFYQGANLHFADKDAFFKVHGIKHVWGLTESGLQDNFDVQNNWGLYDNVVLDKAWEKFSELSSSGQRFALFTLTVDTHPPKGYISPGCSKKNYQIDGRSVEALSAVLCSQEDIARFVERIQSSPWARNTIIVLSSDHLAMPSTAVSVDYLNKLERRDLFFVLGPQVKPGVKAQPRTTLDNGATVLDLLGGGTKIGLGRSSASEKSLAESVPDFKNKLYAWGDSIRNLWGTPNHIDRFTVNTREKTFSFSGRTYPLPIVIDIKKDQVLPVIDDDSRDISLRQSLAYLSEGEKFIWVDKCFHPGTVWMNSLVLSEAWCVTQGRAGGNIVVKKIDGKKYDGKVNTDDTPTNTARYQREQALLKVNPEDIRYVSDTFKFGLDGRPDFIENMMGIGRQEPWGRWSDALTSPMVMLLYKSPFPQKFDVEIEAKAYGKNINAPVAITIGDQTQYAKFGENPTRVTLHYTGDMYSRLITLTPPEPILSREGSILGQSFTSPVRKIGIGLVEIKIVPVAGTAERK